MKTGWINPWRPGAPIGARILFVRTLSDAPTELGPDDLATQAIPAAGDAWAHPAVGLGLSRLSGLGMVHVCPYKHVEGSQNYVWGWGKPFKPQHFEGTFDPLLRMSCNHGLIVKACAACLSMFLFPLSQALAKSTFPHRQLQLPCTPIVFVRKVLQTRGNFGMGARLFQGPQRSSSQHSWQLGIYPEDPASQSIPPRDR